MCCCVGTRARKRSRARSTGGRFGASSSAPVGKSKDAEGSELAAASDADPDSSSPPPAASAATSTMPPYDPSSSQCECTDGAASLILSAANIDGDAQMEAATAADSMQSTGMEDIVLQALTTRSIAAATVGARDEALQNQMNEDDQQPSAASIDDALDSEMEADHVESDTDEPPKKRHRPSTSTSNALSVTSPSIRDPSSLVDDSADVHIFDSAADAHGSHVSLPSSTAIVSDSVPGSGSASAKPAEDEQMCAKERRALNKAIQLNLDACAKQEKRIPAVTPEQHLAHKNYVADELQKWNRSQHTVAGQGDCIFTAVAVACRCQGINLSEQLNGATEATSFELRTFLVKWIRSHKDRLYAISGGDDTWRGKNKEPTKRRKGKKNHQEAQERMTLDECLDQLALERQWDIPWSPTADGSCEFSLGDCVPTLLAEALHLRIALIRSGNTIICGDEVQQQDRVGADREIVIVQTARQEHYDVGLPIRDGQAAKPSRSQLQLADVASSTPAASITPAAAASSTPTAVASLVVAMDTSIITSSQSGTPAEDDDVFAYNNKPEGGASDAKKTLRDPQMKEKMYNRFLERSPTEQVIHTPGDGGCGVWAILLAILCSSTESEDSFRLCVDYLSRVGKKRYTEDTGVKYELPVFPDPPISHEVSWKRMCDWFGAEALRRQKYRKEMVASFGQGDSVLDPLMAAWLKSLHIWIRQLAVAYIRSYKKVRQLCQLDFSEKKCTDLLKPTTWCKEFFFDVVSTALNIDIVVRGFGSDVLRVKPGEDSLPHELASFPLKTITLRNVNGKSDVPLPYEEAYKNNGISQHDHYIATRSQPPLRVFTSPVAGSARVASTACTPIRSTLDTSAISRTCAMFSTESEAASGAVAAASESTVATPFTPIRSTLDARGTLESCTTTPSTESETVVSEASGTVPRPVRRIFADSPETQQLRDQLAVAEARIKQMEDQNAAALLKKEIESGEAICAMNEIQKLVEHLHYPFPDHVARVSTVEAKQEKEPVAEILNQILEWQRAVPRMNGGKLPFLHLTQAQVEQWKHDLEALETTLGIPLHPDQLVRALLDDDGAQQVLTLLAGWMHELHNRNETEWPFIEMLLLVKKLRCIDQLLGAAELEHGKKNAKRQTKGKESEPLPYRVTELRATLLCTIVHPRVWSFAVRSPCSYFSNVHANMVLLSASSFLNAYNQVAVDSPRNTLEAARLMINQCKLLEKHGMLDAAKGMEKLKWLQYPYEPFSVLQRVHAHYSNSGEALSRQNMIDDPGSLDRYMQKARIFFHPDKCNVKMDRTTPITTAETDAMLKASQIEFAQVQDAVKELAAHRTCFQELLEFQSNILQLQSGAQA